MRLGIALKQVVPQAGSNAHHLHGLRLGTARLLAELQHAADRVLVGEEQRGEWRIDDDRLDAG